MSVLLSGRIGTPRGDRYRSREAEFGRATADGPTGTDAAAGQLTARSAGHA